MSKLTIAWDNCLASKDKAGTGIYATRLLEQLVKRSDVRMDVMTGFPATSRGSGAAAALRTARNLMWTHAHLPFLLWRRRPDLLHAPAVVAPIISPCPVVITIHDISYLLYPSHFARWWVTYLRSVMPPAVKSAAAITCGSENSKRDIVRAYGIACDKVYVVPYGVDHERFHPRAALHREWAQNHGIRARYVLHVGTFSYRKNIPILLKAVALLRARGKWRGRQLVLAGSGETPLRGGQQILDFIRDLDLGADVVLTGRTPDEYMPGLYASASMLIMPSLYEGFGFPVLEAMASGTPVICSDTSSLPEVGGDAALYFPPFDADSLANAMLNLMQSPALTEQIRRRGLDWAQQFTWQRTAERTVAIYQDVAGSCLRPV
jgi:glycosyltransferase involved in cell wall biosynthesis